MTGILESQETLNLLGLYRCAYDDLHERKLRRFAKDFMSEIRFCVEQIADEKTVDFFVNLTPENAREKLIAAGWRVPEYIDFTNFCVGSWTVEIVTGRKSTQMSTAMMDFQNKEIRVIQGCSS